MSQLPCRGHIRQPQILEDSKSVDLNPQPPRAPAFLSGEYPSLANLLFANVNGPKNTRTHNELSVPVLI